MAKVCNNRGRRTKEKSEHEGSQMKGSNIP